MRVNIPALLADAMLTLAITFSWMSLNLARIVVAPLFVEVLAMVLCTLPMLWIRSNNLQLLSLIAVTFALFGVWWAELGGSPAFMGLVAFAIFLVRRIRGMNLMQDDFAQFRTLMWDLGIIIVGMFISYASSQTFALADLQGTLMAGGFVLATALRLAGLRNAQLYRAARHGVSVVPSMTKPLLAIGAVFLVVFGVLYWDPHLLLYLFLASLLGILIYTLLNKKNLMEALIILGVFALIFWYLSSATHHIQRGVKVHLNRIGPGKLALGKGHAAHAHISPMLWYSIGMGAIIALLIVLYVLQRRAKRTLDVQQVAPVVERTKMDDGSRRRRRGNSPLAQLMVNWLDWEQRSGYMLGRGETVRQFYGRVHEEAPMVDQQADGHVETLVGRYETERYGLSPAKEEEVSKLGELLRRAGIFGRKRRNTKGKE